MTYREAYAKKRAIEMFWQNSDRAAVVEMLQAEGVGARSAALAEEYYRSYQFIRGEQEKQKRKAAGLYLTVGLVFLAAALGFALLTYFVFDGAGSVVLTGLLLAGVAATIKGLVDNK